MHSTIGKTRLAGALAAGLLVCATGAMAQGRTLTAQDYAQAERFMSYNTAPLVDHDVQRVKWLDDNHFWYIDHDASGDHAMTMDTTTGNAAPAFDQAKLAAALGKVTGKPVAAGKVPARGFDFSVQKDGRYDIDLMGKHYICDLGGAGECTAKAAAKTGNEPGIVSPDKTKEAFIRDWNLWVRDLATGKETQLTTDGAKDFGYATDNAGWIHTDRAVLNWSPDSKRIATYQQDQRGVGEMYTVKTQVGHPVLDAWKYPLPGDQKVFMIEPVVIDVATRKVVRLKIDPQQRLSSLCDDISCSSDGHWDDLKWAPDSKTFAMVNSSRDRKQVWYRIANVDTGAVRTAFDEQVATYYESGHGEVNWQYLPKVNEAVWPSERNDWNNLYLYSLKTGKTLHPITSGDGNVTEVLHLDRHARELWFVGVGKVPGVNPYYRQFWKVGLDGGKPVLLTPEDADHSISMSPDGKTFVDSWSTPTTPPVTVLRSSANGHIIATIAKADITRLKAAGWVPPIPFTVKARDGKTDLYGIMFKPSNFDPNKKYPVIDYVYPGPQTGSVRGRSFLPSRGDNQALAELGFIVVALDGMGTPWRSASFHHTWYGDMGDNTLPDQVKGIQELAQRYPWIDINRVGIWGHSGGGNTTADAMFRYPDFFKVGWAESGNHDNRNYENDWGEKYQGLLVTNKDGTTNYDNQANQDMAKHLKGRLMLVHGTIDDNVPVGETYLVAEALIRANKDFDMLIIPNVHHGYAASTPYATRRRWDYFVHYLAGNTPPKQYELKKWPWF
ncbi:S9 family peptidase [Rhodanobacter sp. C06]|uniref:S9 family peptidase n=1 Tax=Rhodanobacter sp. C06 TaxID=1945854 RepID=UPI000985E9E8|nr:S9 family peptidase [Rhodanobacter sp. C06]OOG49934.1 S9 family peptidase [Rhodanobacter sp. C06]